MTKFADLQRSALRALVSVAAISLLAACGGGGEGGVVDTPTSGGGGGTPTPTNNAPSISGSPSGSVKADEPFSFTPTASDPDGDTLTFSVTNQPSWMDSFDTATGRIAGTPGPGDVGTYSNITITVSDGALSDSLNPFTVSVTQISNGSVTLSWSPPTQNTDGTQLNDLAGYAFYYGTTPGSYPNRLQVNDPGISAYVVENLTPDTYYFVAVAIKTNGLESDYSNEAIKQVM